MAIAGVRQGHVMDPAPLPGPSGRRRARGHNNGWSKMEEQYVAASLYTSIHAAIEQEVARLHACATAVADEFWDLHFWHRKNSNKELWGSYGVRVRERANTVSIDWYRMVFYGPPGQRRVTHNHLKRGNGTRYSRSTFKQAQAWEIDAIMAAEARLEKIRRAAERLVTIGQQARYYDATIRALEPSPDTVSSGA